MNALEQATAYANDAECPIVARAHILALLEMVRRATRPDANGGDGDYFCMCCGCGCQFSSRNKRALVCDACKVPKPFDEAKESELCYIETIDNDKVAAGDWRNGNYVYYKQGWLARASIAAKE